MADRISYGPFTLFESDAYKQAQAMKAEEAQLKLDKLRYDLADARTKQEMESMSGRATKAAEAATVLEQMRQKDQGVDISKVPNVIGKSLLDMNKEEGQRLIEERAGQAKQMAIENYLAGEKSILPSANIDMGGIKRTVLAPQAGQAMGDAYEQTYQSIVPRAANTYMAEGYDSDTAYKMASADARNLLLKERSRGNVTIMSADMQTSYPIPYSQAEAMWRDPKTPAAQRKQLNKVFGEPEQSKAPSWIQTRLGR
jgi:hypothetical protein